MKLSKPRSTGKSFSVTLSANMWSLFHSRSLFSKLALILSQLNLRDSWTSPIVLLRSDTFSIRTFREDNLKFSNLPSALSALIWISLIQNTSGVISKGKLSRVRFSEYPRSLSKIELPDSIFIQIFSHSAVMFWKMFSIIPCVSEAFSIRMFSKKRSRLSKPALKKSVSISRFSTHKLSIISIPRFSCCRFSEYVWKWSA